MAIMLQEMIVFVEDLRFVRIRCAHCNTTLVLDLKGAFAPTKARGSFVPKHCPMCGEPYDGAVQPCVESLHGIYQELLKLEKGITFTGEPESTGAAARPDASGAAKG
jgi:hypothetical protein